jgi:glyoxylase-like metal-dependent hydrolase (beta-lactamase superfamily II)
MTQNFSSNHFTLEKVSEGIYAAIAKDGGGAIGNAGFVDLGDQTIVFDTFNTPQAALDLKNAAETITNREVTWVVNSHHHGDHTRGNQVFPSSHILASETTFIKLKELHPARIEKQQQDLDGLNNYIRTLQDQYKQTNELKLQNQISFLQIFAASLPELRLTLPQYTFKDEFTFHGSKRTAKLISMGSGHSYCDSFLFIPEDRVIFTGDLLVIDTHPAVFEESNLDNWLVILEEMRTWDINVAIPGHGSVGTKSDLNKIVQYMKDIQILAQSTVDPEQIKIPLPYQNWSFPEFFKNNIKQLRELVTN